MSPWTYQTGRTGTPIFVANGSYTAVSPSSASYLDLSSSIHLIGSPSKPTLNTGIMISGKSNIVVENLNIVNSNLTASKIMGVYVSNGSSGVEIKGNEIVTNGLNSTPKVGIYNINSTIDLIQGNTMGSGSLYGIYNKGD